MKNTLFHLTITVRAALLITLLFAIGISATHAQEESKTASPQNGTKGSAPQTYTKEGIAVQFSMEPVAAEHGKSADLMAGTEATVKFRITAVNGGNALNNLRPAAWIDRREADQAPDARACREKVQSFLQPSFGKRASIDLNAYLILALNHEPNISVIDPLSGFGGSKLYTLIALPSSGEDWVMSADKKRLYVSMPLIDQVAVIDIATWKSIANLDAGAKPSRIVLQHDGRYLWVGNDGASGGITVIDTVTLKVAAQLRTGAGHHEVAFADDDSLAFVTNKQDGTLSVVDVRKLGKVKDIKIGTLPAGIAFSSLSKAIYVANEGDGSIVSIDDARLEIQARMKAQPGLGAIRIPVDSRYGFAVNGVTNKVYIFDLSANRVVHAVPVGPGADQITFTREFAYVRSPANEFVTMIKISDLGKEAAITRFPAGQKAAKESPASSLADAIVAAPEDGAVLVANPADKMIYYYTEGMAAPMGSFQNYRRDPKALLILDSNLREIAGGEYSTTVRLGSAGHYDVAFLLDSPRLVNCFAIDVVENPALPKPTTVAIKVEPLLKEASARVGESYQLRFKVTDSSSSQPQLNLVDVGVLVFLAPGIWQQREWAKQVSDGVYEISFVPPQAGVYYVYFQCPSLKVRFNEINPVILEAIKR